MAPLNTRQDAQNTRRDLSKSIGIIFACQQPMNGSTAGRALESRFNAVLRAEIERLGKKLRGLTDEDRQTVEALTADIIQAIARAPAERLAGEVPAQTVDAAVRLFALDSNAAPAAQ